MTEDFDSNLLNVGYEVTRTNPVFSKNDIINAYLRAGVAVEHVEERAMAFMDAAIEANRIRPLNNTPEKFVKVV